MTNMKNTPALSRFPTDSSADDELDRALRTPPDHQVVSRGQLVPAHSPNEQFIGTPFSTSNMFEYPFHPEEQSPRDSKPIAIKTGGGSAQHSSNGSSPSSPHYVRALREVSKEAPIPPSLREKVTALGARVPYWNFQLWSVERNTRLIFPAWPKDTLGDLRAGFRPYEQAGSTVLSTVQLETLLPAIWFANAEACHQILDFHETRFRKDMSAYELIMFHGPNIVASEGPLWRRYRKASRLAFAERSYSLVWEETNRILGDWFREIQNTGQGEVEVDTLKGLRKFLDNKVALNTIASVGFGEQFPWDSPLENDCTPNRLSFPASVTQAVGHTTWRALTPQWAYRLPVSVFARTKLAFEEMDRHFGCLVQERLDNGITDDSDPMATVKQGSLLRGLMRGNAALNEGQKLTTQELLSNAYVFLLAGHDTTAHTLAFATAILALYPSVHIQVREEADRLWPGACIDPAARNASSYKEDFHQLVYTQAVFEETMRHFPAEPIITRTVGEDTALPGTRRDPNHPTCDTFSQSFNVPLRKGDCVVANIYGLHMNTHYWGPNAADFEPARFLESDWPKHAFMPFSDGPRGCIGRGFAIAEAVRTIATLAQDWDIRCKDSMMDMTWEARKEMLLRWRQEVTMVPVEVKLTFKKRTG